MNDTGSGVIAQWLLDLGQELRQATGELVDDFSVILIGLAAVGFLAMTVVNAVKQPLRRAYLMFRMGRFIAARTGTKADADRVHEYLWRSASISRFSFYSLDIGPLFSAIGRVRNLATGALLDEGARRFVEAWLRPEHVEELVTAHSESYSNEDLVKINTSLDTTISGLQVSMQHWWSITKRSMAMTFSVMFVFLLIDIGTIKQTIFAIGGGLFAPYAHDVLTNLRKAKVQ